METTITIRRWDNGNVIFSYTCEDNSFSKTLEKAVNEKVDLSFANLTNLILKHLDLSNANLTSANFAGSLLYRINFTNANLEKSIFSFNSTLIQVNLDNAKGLNDQCPKKGSFIGWKKCYSNKSNKAYIVKLEIPKHAKRCSATTEKCRCSKAKVLEIQNIDGAISNITEVYSLFYNKFSYKLGEIIYSESFDDRYWVECSHGIHFFMNREDAVNYDFF